MYTGFGGLLPQSVQAAADSFRFMGREYDVETGLMYYWARYNNSISESFLSEDPVRIAHGDFGVYRNLRTSPLLFTDHLSTSIPVKTGKKLKQSVYRLKSCLKEVNNKIMRSAWSKVSPEKLFEFYRRMNYIAIHNRKVATLVFVIACWGSPARIRSVLFAFAQEVGRKQALSTCSINMRGR